MITLFRSPSRSQRITARISALATVIVAALICFSGWRYIEFARGLPEAQATMQGFMVDLSHKNWSQAQMALAQTQYPQGLGANYQFNIFKNLTRQYGAALSYRCIQSNSQFYFPSLDVGNAWQIYKVQFAHQDAIVRLFVRPGHSSRIYGFDVSDNATQPASQRKFVNLGYFVPF
jgi:hypothetical protein